jgi:phosphoribosylamine--glycine ligase
VNDFASIKKFMLDYAVNMLVVGPEDPLVNGIYDFFAEDAACAHIAVIGPSQEAAKLEGSKAFAKKFMAAQGVPTAAYREFTPESLQEGLDYLANHALPIVLKADGLAAGKGVLILNDRQEAQTELTAMLSGKFGEASRRVVVEAFLDGIEFSMFAITDGVNYKMLSVAKDYKRIGEGDTGLNTGGMGAVSPPPFVDETLYKKVINRIVEPTIAGFQQQNMLYKGFVFFGLISVKGEPFVIEYNCRMGDPETEVVIPRLQNDLVDIFIKIHENRVNELVIQEDPRAAATVMLVSGGYPNDYAKGKPITGWQNVQNCLLFHAGTSEFDGAILTNGGRVLAITSYGNLFTEAVANSLQNADKIQFDGKYFRRDIGKDLAF